MVVDMSFINRLFNSPSFSPKNEREITLADIAKCRGSSSIVTQSLSQIQVFFRTGRFVTDRAVTEFILNHSTHLDEISKAFEDLSNNPNLNVEVKQLQKEQGVARRLANVFIKVSSDIHIENENFNSDMKTSHVVFKALKVMDAHDPADLIRAVALKIDPGIESSQDLKHQFSQFVIGKEIKTEDDLKASFQEFKDQMSRQVYDGDVEARDRMISYTWDKSIRKLDSKEFNQIRMLAIPDLLEVLSGKSGLQSKIINENGLAAMKRFDPVELIRAAVYDKMKGITPKDDLKSHFGEYVKEIEIKNAGDLNIAYSQYQNKLAAAVLDGDHSAIEKMQKYREDQSLEKFTSLYEKSNSELQADSKSSEFEEVDFSDYPSLVDEVKGMRVEELLVELRWRSR